MNKTAFGTFLRQKREEKNISLRELAKKIGVSGPFLSDIELGRRFPAAEKIEAIANEIGVPVEELRQYDFRDEAESIRQMMFADPAAGMVFRTLRTTLQSGMSATEIQERLKEQG